MVVMFNGELVKDAKISVFSDAVMRGFGVFETLRTYGGKVFELEAHLERLFASADRIGLDIEYCFEEIGGMVLECAESCGEEMQRIKVLCVPEGVFVICELLEVDDDLYRGVEVVSYETVRYLPEVKTISYLPSFLAHNYAVERGVYEAILYGGSLKEVYEGAYSNLFWVKDGVLFTREDGVLKGVTREVVLKIYPEVVFEKIFLDELCEVDELFLTQTSKGVLPIVSVDGKRIGDGKVGVVTQKVVELFSSYVSCECG